jgi:hypothetical protein
MDRRFDLYATLSIGVSFCKQKEILNSRSQIQKPTRASLTPKSRLAKILRFQTNLAWFIGRFLIY